MDVSLWVWLATIAGIAAIFAADLLLADRHPHVIAPREAVAWVAVYVAAAGAFGAGMTLLAGGTWGGQFFAGYVTEYSLSVDNLFVFIVIMSAFGVPLVYQHHLLLWGIIIALVMRGGFIAAGAAAIANFSWVLYLLGAFLVYTAVGLVRSSPNEDKSFNENRLMRVAMRVLPTTTEYHDKKLVVRSGGRRVGTPMLVAMIAIGTTDLLFALDSIPAIFGLTKHPYIVLTSNAFALMGLRQLYFLVNGLLDKLAHLSKGLAVILGFIGAKLVLEAMHEEGVGWAPEIPTALSLIVIVAILAVTVATSLIADRRRGRESELGSEGQTPLPDEASVSDRGEG